jgi:hypothetical protein
MVLPAISAALLASGCDSSSSSADGSAELSALHGTWSADKVPVSDLGHFAGISTHEYNADGTYRPDAEFTVPDSGCPVELHDTGSYSGDAATIEVRPSGGEVEVTSCNDASQNAARRPYDASELEQGNSTLKWGIENGVLSLVHDDGLERTFRRQKDTLASLYGTWASDSVAVSGHGQYAGQATHAFNEDGTFRWNAEFTDPESGCRAALHYRGGFTGNATLISARASAGEVEVTGCSDNARNAPTRGFDDAELAAASDSLAWSVAGDTLVLSHSDGLQREYSRQ